jgi:radical SAM protein with 4Fe4S-binding SPASM domain
MREASPEISRLRSAAAENAVPLHAQIELTHRCNLRCRHCYLHDSHDARGEELTLSELTGIFAQLAEMQTLFLAFTGGEIFLRPDAVDIIRAARRLGFACVLLTNGTLIDDRLAGRIADLQPLQVHVSLLGLEQAHDAMTMQPGSFRQTLAAMQALRSRGVKVVAKLVVTREAIADAEALRRLAAEQADETVFSTTLIPTLAGDNVGEELHVRPEELCRLSFDCKIPEFSNPGWPPEATVCNAGRGLLAVSPYGEVFPCIGFRMQLGNARETALEEIWRGEKLRQLRLLRRGDLPDCAGCDRQEYCTFCPGVAWSVAGDYRRAVPELCQKAERLRKFLDLKRGGGR